MTLINEIFRRRFALALLIAVCIVSCGKKKDTVPVSDEVIGQPYQEIDTSTMCYYNKGKIQWKLDSRHMKRVLADTGHVMANPVKLLVFDSLGKEMSKVLSDSGSMDGGMQMFCVWGNVFVLSSSGMRVRSQRLFWNLKTHLITSGDYVELKTKNNDVLRGKGLEADENFTWWKFLHDVSGRFPNFKERVEKGEEF
jgi:LPS export ABC transporter protein LptC